MDKITLNGKEFYLKHPDDVFSFKCQQCTLCCKGTNPQLFPFDIFRLCKGMNLTTTELHSKHTTFITNKNSAPLCYLKTVPICQFNKDSLCSVYEHRPLLCRLFPLGFTHLRDRFVLNEYICMGIGEGEQHTIAEWNEKAGMGLLIIYLEALKKIDHKKLKHARSINKKEFDTLYKEIFYDFDSNTIETLREKLDEKKPKTIEDQMNLIVKLSNTFLVKNHLQ